MDNAMRDAFARQGYIVVPNVLNQQQLDELNQAYDQHIFEREGDAVHGPHRQTEPLLHRRARQAHDN